MESVVTATKSVVTATYCRFLILREYLILQFNHFAENERQIFIIVYISVHRTKK